MSFAVWLAKLSGARGEILRKAPGDVNKHAAMGGVLLSTAAVAAVSAFFALHSVLRLPVVAAAVAGVAWGVVIFNLDRMLVITMTRGNGWLLNLLAAIPRVGLAVVIGSIISMPLVLKIFEPEINSELVAMQAETTQRNQEDYDKAYARITELEAEESELLAILSGRSSATVADDPDVKAAKSALDKAEEAYQAANQLAQCEFDGTCGTGVPGDGESYRQKKRAADDARNARDKAQSALDEVTEKVAKRLREGAATDTGNAQKRLPEVQADLQRLRQDREGLERRGTVATAADTGLLARLEALDRLTEGRRSGAQAHYALFLLFLCVELLPVVVKLLSSFGPETLYDRMAKRADDASDADDKLWADRDRDLEADRADQKLAMERQKLDAQTQAHAKTTQLVADKQLGMAMKAIDVWADLARLRTDEELDRWYREHAGGDQRTMPIPRVHLPHTGNGAHVNGAHVNGSTPNGVPTPNPS
ncbi:DUF4407 domain-containing protein [Saccharothrix coeruleofusca]|uniref:DUF4407 domain-containing protein n=1 Tax=Saccharothrix coeruleofusca TaxID=33919 RepID=A0A918ED36_9PSEU|nr:DUF4407 domain-containing protein [Saccharothrix coeruleofusca]GGP44814.1 hypothetical protein GCM10010185_15700 [Saccharothrix coeruleofusca]